MKAIVQNGYGSTDVLTFKELDRPVLKEHQILVRVHAAGVNSGDYFTLSGSPWLVRLSVGFPRPKDHVLGWDVAGVVESVKAAADVYMPVSGEVVEVDRTPIEWRILELETLRGGPLDEEERRAISAPGFSIGPGEIGCYLSHIRIYQQMQDAGMPLALPGDAVFLESPFLEFAILLIRLQENSFSALSAQCTHLGCEVRKEPSMLRCPCHDSAFDFRWRGRGGRRGG